MAGQVLSVLLNSRLGRSAARVQHRGAGVLGCRYADTVAGLYRSSGIMVTLP